MLQKAPELIEAEINDFQEQNDELRRREPGESGGSFIFFVREKAAHVPKEVFCDEI